MRKPNLKGCVIREDVCLLHCEPLICSHGCGNSTCTCEDAIKNRVPVNPKKEVKS